MKNSLLIKILFLLFIISTLQSKSVVYAQDTLSTKDTLDIYEMSLEQLLNIKAHGVSSELEKLINSLIGVASKKPLSSRESPSIVSLITEEEIKNSGARDLIDVLQLVPGIDFGMDVFGVVGIGMRGNWSHEGKVLMLLDGQEMNEILNGTNQFGNHFPVDQIKKIEIIRGPGSAIYGGYAEYGVINIITKGAEDLNGISVSGIYGQMKDTYGRRNINLSGGGKIRDVAMSLSAFMGQGNRSDQDYTDVFGTTYNMAGNSNLNPSNINLGITYKDLSFRGIFDNYKTTLKDGYDEAREDIYIQNFESYFAELKYNYKVNDKFSIIPRVNYKHQLPWATPSISNVDDDFQKVTDRYTGNLTLSYNFTRKINFIAGAEVFADHAQDNVDSSYFSNGEKTVNYLNRAYFTQGLIKHRIVNIILGARYDEHSDYGSAFVPRVGLTKKINKLHFKLLYSNAFRAPAIENITQQDSSGIKPERTEVIELEAGYQITRKSIVTVNFFDITTKDPIVYYYDDINNLDRYHNLGMSGSKGIELEYRLKDKWGYLNFNYSFYTVAGKEKTADYEVSENENVLLAFPAHKVNVNSNIIITKHLSINPSLSYRSERYGYTSVDTLGNAVLEKFNPILLANIFVNYTNLFTKGLNIGIGVYDILDVRYKFIQPYNSNHAPLPGPSRELVIKLSYDFNFKDKNKS